MAFTLDGDALIGDQQSGVGAQQLIAGVGAPFLPARHGFQQALRNVIDADDGQNIIGIVGADDLDEGRARRYLQRFGVVQVGGDGFQADEFIAGFVAAFPDELVQILPRGDGGLDFGDIGIDKGAAPMDALNKAFLLQIAEGPPYGDAADAHRFTDDGFRRQLQGTGGIAAADIFPQLFRHGVAQVLFIDGFAVHVFLFFPMIGLGYNKGNTFVNRQSAHKMQSIFVRKGKAPPWGSFLVCLERNYFFSITVMRPWP